MKKTIILIVVLVALLGLGIYFSSQTENKESTAAVVTEQQAVTPVPATENTKNASVTSMPVTQLKDISVGDEIQLSNPQDKVALVSGWSVVESWGIWSDGKSATFMISSKNLPEKFKMALHYVGFLSGTHTNQSYEIYNEHDQLLKKCDINAGTHDKTVVLNITKARDASADGNTVSITIKMLDPISPKDAGLSGDERVLGMGLCDIKILP